MQRPLSQRFAGLGLTQFPNVSAAGMWKVGVPVAYQLICLHHGMLPGKNKRSKQVDLHEEFSWQAKAVCG